MHYLRMGALHGAAADSIAHERLQALPQLRRFRPQKLQPGDDLLYVSGAQILCNDMNPTIGLRGTFPVTESSELPSMLHSVPEVEDLATPHFRPIPTITTTV
ncbi:MAG TPA: hypothetical protein VGS58_00550 [Candidatus Sulfopaludibacter sp.]|nr:hypothetical protein [Candidatus Sulfopaludibacter sp.]